MSTVTRTVMFTDLSGFTDRVGRTDREGLRRILVEHEDLVSPVVVRYHGRVVKNLGDSFLCLFESATDALRAALDIQDVVVQAGGIRIRMGIATGDVEEIDGDAFGETVNLASRILNQAQEGEVWFSLASRLCMNSAEIPWEPVARLELKGIAGDVEVFRAVPSHRCWLPDTVVQAARRSRLVRLRRGSRLGVLPPPDPVILLEGFAPGSAELAAAIDELPVLDPAALWLVAFHLSAADRHAWTSAGRGLVVGTPNAIDRALLEASRVSSRTSGTDTIVFDSNTQVDFVLMVAGLALPTAPLADVVESYTYDLGQDGVWVNRSERPALRIEVLPEGPRLIVTSQGVAVNGRSRQLDEVMPLSDGMTIQFAGIDHVWRQVDEEYVGLLVSESATRLGVAAGQVVELGREPQHPGLKLVDRKGASNLRWCAGPKAGKARASGFTLDRALAGRRQTSVAVVGGGLQVTTIHDRCPTWRLRPGSSTPERIQSADVASVGDLLIVGTWVVEVRGREAW